MRFFLYLCSVIMIYYPPLYRDKVRRSPSVDYWGSLGQYLHSTARQLTVVADTTVIKEEITEYDSPIPTLHGGLQRVTTIRKSTQSVQYSLSVGFGYFAPSFSWGSYGERSDYMDMNGDGFPDFVGSGAVQYTRPWGGIGELVPSLTNSFVSSTYSNGYSFSGSRPQGDHITGNGVKDGRMKNSEKSIGISNQSGGDNTITSFTDMNADGLPDIVDASGQRVRYNLGYAFTNWQNMPGLEISSGVHSDASFSLGFSLNQFSISGGLNSSNSTNSALQKLVDIDGDGHPDVVSYDSYSGTTGIRLNNGYSFQSQQPLNMPTVQNSTTTSSGVSVSGTGGFTLFILPIKLTFGIQMCPWAQSNTETNSDFMDMNGDGYVDWVTTTSSGLQVRYNKNGSRPVNLLTSVVNPTGQTISMDYTLSTPSIVHRTRTWNMTQAIDSISPVLDDSHKHQYAFSYINAFYDNFEKTDYGYGGVNTNDQNTKYLEETYENRFYISRGEKTSELLLNHNYQPLIGHTHEIRYYDSLDVEHSDACNDIYLHVGTEGYWTDYYETVPAPMITTSYNKFYDNKHNLIRYDDYGDIAITGDEWVQTIAYKPNTAHNMISLPRLEVIHSDSLTGPVMRRRRANYDWSGKPVQIIFEDTHTLQKAIHTIGYDVFGNVNNYCAPWNENYERVNYKYLYDTIAETHVTQVQNQFGETHYFGYDMRHGLRNWSRDPAGNEMHWQYDMMGRLINLTAPKEFRDSLPFSVHYVYRLPYHELPTNPYGRYLYPHVTKVAADSGLVSAEVTLYDARGKEMQKKMWKRVGTAYTWVANGLFLRDQWYNPKKTFDPFVTPAASLWELDMTHHLSYQTNYQYDALDRVTQIDYPDLTHVSHTYHFEHDPILGNYRLAAYKTDENSNTTLTLTSPQQWTILTETPNNERTLYKYNAIGELKQVVDADSYVTNYAYDMFGNRIWRQHPDAGDTWWHYAPDGSLKSTKTARLNLAADSITYEYCFGRLMKIHYPLSPEMNVSNIYDQAGRLGLYIDATGRTRLYYDELGNVRTTIRRVIMPTETSAYTFRTHTEYDSFGRMKYILYPDGDSVAYSYYPSGELSDVERNPLLGSSALVVAKMEYDPMGHNTHREYGNTVQTTYQYEPYRNRLSRLMTEIPSSCILQKIDYYYDGVGNITRIEQDQPACAALGGEYLNDYTYDNNYRLTRAQCNIGSFRYNFQASYSPAGRVGNNYCDNTGIVDVDAIYGYDNHYITHQPRVVHDGKSGAHMQLYWDADGNLFSVEDCKSGQNRFHDWDDAGRMRMFLGSSKSGYYGYEANGERVYKLTGTSSKTYTLQHDFAASVYFDNAVIYPNPYVVITDKGYTKHYYANSERLATVFGQGGWMTMSSNFMDHLTPYEEDLLFNLFFRYKGTSRPFGHPIISDMPNCCDINDNVVQEVQYDCDSVDLVELAIEYDKDILAETMLEYKGPQGSEKDVYYTHNDHLGSAAWITDQDAKPVQYLHYLPYGQLLANQSPSGYDERFKFIGKERDLESGYDYFGARYLATTFLHFTSPEPLLDDYLQISPYSYAAWNPIKYYDFKGNNPRTGRPGQYQNGMYKMGSDATFIQPRVQHQSQKMDQSSYYHSLSKINEGTISASPTPKENLLNSLNSFEGAMIQSPIIQSVATGLLSVGGALAIGEAASMAVPSLLETGVQLQGLTLQGIQTIETSAKSQFISGFINGGIGSFFDITYDLPDMIETTPYKIGETTGQFVYKLGSDFVHFTRPPTTNKTTSTELE